jgi:DNA-binding IclR family transcriptional regulator
MSEGLVKSAARAFDVMEVFVQQRKPLTATQLGASLGYPKSSLSVLLRSLAKQGYLSFDPDEATYFPTLRVTHLGDWLPATLLGSNVLLPMLSTLRDRTGETVTLTMSSGTYMRTLTALPGTNPIALQLEEGFLFPTFGTAVGTAYLATLEQPQITALLQQANAQAERGKAMDAAEVFTMVENARRQGFASAYDRVVPDTGAIAIAVRPRQNSDVVVIAVAGLNHRIHRAESKIVRELKRVARWAEEARAATD